jgi:hypothetical protein
MLQPPLQQYGLQRDHDPGRSIFAERVGTLLRICMHACKQAILAVLGLTGCRRTLMPGGAGLEAFLDIPEENILQADSNALAVRALIYCPATAL